MEELYQVEILKWKGREIPGGHIIPDLLNLGTIRMISQIGGNCSIQITQALELKNWNRGQSTLILGA